MRPASFAPQRNVDDREGLFQDGLVDWACLVALKDPIALRRIHKTPDLGEPYGSRTHVRGMKTRFPNRWKNGSIIKHNTMFRAEGVDSFCQVELLCS